jgi:thioredoxin-related protein
VPGTGIFILIEIIFNIILKIAGHRPEGTFLKYIKVTEVQDTKKLEQYWRKFNQSLNNY